MRRVLATVLAAALLLVIAPTVAADHETPLHWNLSYPPTLNADGAAGLRDYAFNAGNAWLAAENQPGGLQIKAGGQPTTCNLQRGIINVCWAPASQMDGYHGKTWRYAEGANHIYTAAIRLCWDCDWGPAPYDRKQAVMTHELGHAIGLNHSAGATSVMHPQVPVIWPGVHDGDAVRSNYRLH